MNKNLKIVGIFIVIAFIGSMFLACSSRMLDFTIVSNKNVNLNITDSAKGPRVSGSHHVWWILFVPVGSPNLEEAVDRAIEKAGPEYDALIDGVIYNQFYFFLLTSKAGFKVEGTPVKSSQIAADWDEENILFHSSTGKDNSKNFQKLLEALPQQQSDTEIKK